MNLGLEYLLRHGVVREFFRLPASLFLENRERAMVVTMHRSIDHANGCKVGQWSLDLPGCNDLPRCEDFEIKCEEMFGSAKIIVPGMRPIQFHEQSVPDGLNHYDSPIEASDYRGYIRTFLNPHPNRRYKSDWLWEHYIKRHVGRLIFPGRFDLRGFERRDLAEKERLYVKKSLGPLWDRWHWWIENLMPPEDAASEIVFLPYFSGVPTSWA